MNAFMRAWHAFTNKTMFESYVSDFLTGGDLSKYDSAENNMLKYSAVFACIRVLSETFSSVTIHEYKEDIKSDDRERTNDTGFLKLLKRKPNSYMSAFNFWEMAMVQLNIDGNFYARKVFNNFGFVAGFQPLLSENVEVKIEDGEIVYIISNDGSEGETKKETRDSIFHVVGFSFDGIIGMSPMEYFRSIYKLGLTYQNFSQNYYDNGAKPSGIFEAPQTGKAYNDTAYERLKDDLNKRTGGVHNSGKPLLLEDGLTYKAIDLKLADAELLASKRFQIEDIARVYRVPLHLIQELLRATNNNIEHQSLEFVMYTMLPWFKRIEMAINTQLLSDTQVERGYYFEFNMNSLLRGDIKTRGDYYTKGKNGGWLSTNDIRRFEKMNSIGPSGDIYLEPLNMKEAGTETEDDSSNNTNENKDE